MKKYEPLRRYLVRQKSARVDMSFLEIERVLGAFLPKAAHRDQWWTRGDADADPLERQGWGQAGYRARMTASERVVFERV